jgi:hypothetical protein
MLGISPDATRVCKTGLRWFGFFEHTVSEFHLQVLLLDLDNSDTGVIC